MEEISTKTNSINAPVEAAHFQFAEDVEENEDKTTRPLTAPTDMQGKYWFNFEGKPVNVSVDDEKPDFHNDARFGHSPDHFNFDGIDPPMY